MTPGSYTEHGCFDSPTTFLGTRDRPARRARAAARSGRLHAADCGRGTCVHSWAEWVREVHADQDDHTLVLPACSRRVIHLHSGARAMGYFRAAIEAGDCFTGFAGIVHDGREWT